MWGFTAPWDARSRASAARSDGRLDALVSGWIALDSATGAPVLDEYPDSQLARGRSGRQMTLVTSWRGDRFHPRAIRALAADDAALARAASSIAASAAASGSRGLVLDFESLSREDLPALLEVVGAIRAAARARGVAPVAIAVPAADTAGYPSVALAEVADLLVVMLYDEHWSGSPPGPIASPDWVRRTLGARVAEVGPGRIVAALPLYGYLWRTGRAGETIGYEDARRLAAEAGRLLAREPASRTLTASRPGEWTLWVSDAEMVRGLVADAAAIGVRRFALWRLGLEDPAVWEALR